MEIGDKLILLRIYHIKVREVIISLSEYVQW